MSAPIELLTECVKDGLQWLSYQTTGFPSKKGGDRSHLKETVDWLVRAAEHGKGGAASHYSLFHGRWLDPFPETTGYIIPTLFDYAAFSGDASYAQLASTLTEWLGGVQLDNGACMAGLYDEEKGPGEPCVFNTGQNLLGFVRAYRETKREEFLEYAQRAGDFLVQSTDDEGVWDKHLLRGLRHTINTRCSWALLLLHELIPDRQYDWVAQQNLTWTQAQQTENGWFRHGSSKVNVYPNTHFIAYTCRGLIESYLLNNDAESLATATRTADRLLQIYRERGMLYAFWDETWQNRGKHLQWMPGRYICLTGNIQMSLVWMRLFQIHGENSYREAAFEMLDQMKALQALNTGHDGKRGGVKGSFPVYGGYSMLMYPNWAAKFFADALLLKIALQEAA